MIKDAVRYLLIRLRGVSFDWIKLMKSVSSCDGADLQLLSTLGTNEIWAFESTFFIWVNRRDQVKGLNTYKMITLFMKWPSDVSVEICWTLPVNNFLLLQGWCVVAHQESGCDAAGLQDWFAAYARFQDACGSAQTCLSFHLQTQGKSVLI